MAHKKVTKGAYKNLALLASLMLGCIGTSTNIKDINYLNSGSIVLAKKMPEVTRELPGDILAFMPIKNEGIWLQLDQNAGALKLMRGSEVLKSFAVKPSQKLSPARIKLVHKQLNPTWYANDEYYKNRDLAVPMANSKERFLKGALGDSALFFENDISLHSSMLEAIEVGGLRLNKVQMEEIYQALELNSIIDIK